MTIHTRPPFYRFLSRTFLAALLLGTAPLFSATAQGHPGLPDHQKAELTATQWNAFAENTRAALASENDGLKTSALRNIIWYGPRLEVKSSMTKVMHLYRSHSDPQVRRMAVVALGRMDSDFALGYLQLMAVHEKDPTLRKTIRDVVYAAQTGSWEALPSSPSLAQKGD